MFTQRVAPTTVMQGFETGIWKRSCSSSVNVCSSLYPPSEWKSNVLPPISTYKHAPLPALTTLLPRNGNVVYAPEPDMDRLSFDAVSLRALYNLFQSNAVIERFEGFNRFLAEIWLTAYKALREGMPDSNRIFCSSSMSRKTFFDCTLSSWFLVDMSWIGQLFGRCTNFTKIHVKSTVAA